MGRLSNGSPAASSHQVLIRRHGSRRVWCHAVFPSSVASYGACSDVCVIEAQTRCVMLLQVISVLGALMVLSAYGLIQGGVWRELNAGYLALNIVGSLLLGIVAIMDQRVGFIF